MIEDPSVFFEEFADVALFTKADGSFSLGVKCLYEEGVEDFQDGVASLLDTQAQLTCNHAETARVVEGDRAEVHEQVFEILDAVGDGAMRIFKLTPADGKPKGVSFL